MDWTTQLLEQLTFHWDHQVRPGSRRLTDDEYLWEPVPGAWSIRPRAEARTAMAAGGGDLVADFEFPEPDAGAGDDDRLAPGPRDRRHLRHAQRQPLRRAAHGLRRRRVAGRRRLGPGHARRRLRRLGQGRAGLDEAKLAEPVGPAEGPYAAYPYAALVLHINREAIHHLAEVALLRDLYRSRC